MRRLGAVLCAVVALVWITGCAKPPQADIDAANAALSAARSAEAGEYAADSLRAAEDAIAKVNGELKVQEEKFALFRSYKQTATLVADAKAAGEKATADAKAGKQRAMQEATDAISQAKAALTEGKEMLTKAPRGKGTQADLQQLEADLAGAETTVADADAAFASERYKDAKAKAGSAMSTIGSVKSAVEQAIAARQKARGR